MFTPLSEDSLKEMLARIEWKFLTGILIGHFIMWIVAMTFIYKYLTSI